MARRPLIGVTGSARGGRAMWWWNRISLWLAGARAARITPERKLDPDRLDGVVLGGGDHIGADLYRGEVMINVQLDPARDKLECELMVAADRRGLPVLGICRGAQMINVARGGDLHQDIYAQYIGVPRMRTILPKKRVSVEADSRLGRIVGGGAIAVNALHSQSVNRLGRELRVVARDDHGMVQAVEDPRPRFVVGVQWHPEFLVFSRTQRRLYRALAAAARGEDPEKCS